MSDWIERMARSLWATAKKVAHGVWAAMRPKVRPLLRELVQEVAIVLVNRLRTMTPANQFGRLVIDLVVNGIAWAVTRLEQLVDAMTGQGTMSRLSAPQTVLART